MARDRITGRGKTVGEPPGFDADGEHSTFAQWLRASGTRVSIRWPSNAKDSGLPPSDTPADSFPTACDDRTIARSLKREPVSHPPRSRLVAHLSAPVAAIGRQGGLVVARNAAARRRTPKPLLRRTPTRAGTRRARTTVRGIVRWLARETLPTVGRWVWTTCSL